MSHRHEGALERKFAAPERASKNWSQLAASPSPAGALDIFSLGVLVNDVFALAQNAGGSGRPPAKVAAAAAAMLSQAPGARPSAAQVSADGQQAEGQPAGK